jgi:serine/threonine-protein kinase ATR
MILTYSLNKTEWVPNLRPYKEIIMSEYKKKGHRPPSMQELGTMNIEHKEKEEQIKEYRRLIEKFYPALGDYFRQQFPTPQNFFKARSAYIKSTAVWSIVGYIMGLGDRHGENILIDVCSGETFHVDCNLLFNKGETLTVPESVPFRLTHNMTHAMGVLGIEGPFRKSCEIILRVLQKEKRTLLAYVRPIIYDTIKKSQPDMTRRDMSRTSSEVVEIPNLQKFKRVEARLNGIVQKFGGSSEIPLSTEGQVNFLIKEATSEENLAAMYRGWLPWM